jgi:hypothetical protein
MYDVVGRGVQCTATDHSNISRHHSVVKSYIVQVLNVHTTTVERCVPTEDRTKKSYGTSREDLEESFPISLPEIYGTSTYVGMILHEDAAVEADWIVRQ